MISQTFEDWLAATFYNHLKQESKKKGEKGESGDTAGRYGFTIVKVLSADDIKKIQTILRFEANNSGEVITLNSRVAAFIDEEDPGNSVIYYDLVNKDWDIIKITCNGWSLEKNYPNTIDRMIELGKLELAAIGIYRRAMSRLSL